MFAVEAERSGDVHFDEGSYRDDEILDNGVIRFGPLLSRGLASQFDYRSCDVQSSLHSSLKIVRRITSSVLGGAVGGWLLGWATAYVLSDIHFITVFSLYFAGCYLTVCLLFLLLASSSSSPISLRTFLAGLGLLAAVMCLLLQKSIRHVLQTRKLGFYWSPFLRNVFDSVVGGVVSVTCLLSTWACLLMSSKCCIRGGKPWPSGAQVLFASCVAFVIGSAAGLEFGQKLTENPKMKPGRSVTIMCESLAWQTMGVWAGMLGTLFVRELVPRWNIRAPILDADMESLAVEFGPTSIIQFLFATASAPVASILGRVQQPFFSESQIRLENNDAELDRTLQSTS